MQPEHLLQQINAFAEARANAHTCAAMVGLSEDDAERAHLNARTDYWNSQVNEQWAKLTAATHSALPPTVYAMPDPLAPVTAPNDQQVEVRGTVANRAVSIRMSPAQAVGLGTALVACAAALNQHTGGRLADVLPPIPPSPPGAPVRPA